jgi:hypothetical protein
VGQIRAARIAVDDDPQVEIASARDADSFLITNRDAANSVYVGATGVTSAAGYELKAGESIELDLDGEDKAYAICSTGQSATLHVLKV